MAKNIEIKTEENNLYITTAEIGLVEWRTFPTGYAHPIAIFKDAIEVNEFIRIEYLIIKDIDEVKKYNIQIGQKLNIQVIYSNNNQYDVKIMECLQRNSRHHQIIEACPKCGSKLKLDDFGLECTNHMCQAKSVTALMRLYSIFSLERDLDAFKYYLNNFPTYNGNAKVTNLQNYFKLFGPIGNPNIEPRYELLKDINPDIFTFEVDLYQKLRSGFFVNGSREANGIFWYMVNLDGMPIDMCLRLLGDINPFFQIDEKLLRSKKVPEDIRNLIIENSVYIGQLCSDIKAFKFDK
jgi:hypothetical protein